MHRERLSHSGATRQMSQFFSAGVCQAKQLVGVWKNSAFAGFSGPQRGAAFDTGWPPHWQERIKWHPLSLTPTDTHWHPLTTTDSHWQPMTTNDNQRQPKTPTDNQGQKLTPTDKGWHPLRLLMYGTNNWQPMRLTIVISSLNTWMTLTLTDSHWQML